jgi:hypothetical protein
VRNRSEIARKVVVPPAQLCEGPSLRRTWSASSHYDGTWLTTHQHLHGSGGSVASALYDVRLTCSQHSKRSRRLARRRGRNWVALGAAILSGIPNIMIALFLHCSVSARDILPELHSRRTREIPLAREDIPGSTFRCASSAPPPGPDVISNISL